MRPEERVERMPLFRFPFQHVKNEFLYDIVSLAVSGSDRDIT